VAGAGGEGDQLGIEAVVLLGEVDWRRKVLGHIADFQRGGHGVGEDVSLVEIAHW